MHTMITLLAQAYDEHGHHVDPLSEYSPWWLAVSNLGVWLILLLLVLTVATMALWRIAWVLGKIAKSK